MLPKLALSQYCCLYLIYRRVRDEEKKPDNSTERSETRQLGRELRNQSAVLALDRVVWFLSSQPNCLFSPHPTILIKDQLYKFHYVILIPMTFTVSHKLIKIVIFFLEFENFFLTFQSFFLYGLWCRKLSSKIHSGFVETYVFFARNCKRSVEKSKIGRNNLVF